MKVFAILICTGFTLSRLLAPISPSISAVGAIEPGQTADRKLSLTDMFTDSESTEILYRLHNQIDELDVQIKQYRDSLNKAKNLEGHATLMLEHVNEISNEMDRKFSRAKSKVESLQDPW